MDNIYFWKTAKCTVTGFTWVITACWYSITWEVNYNVEPTSWEPRWIHVNRIEILTEGERAETNEERAKYDNPCKLVDRPWNNT